MAIKIKNLGTTSLTIAAHAKFHGEVIALINAATEILHLEAIHPQYLAAITAEDEVVNRPGVYAETKQMQTADHNRDMGISLTFNLTDAYLRSPLTAQSAAAEQVSVAINPYRNIQSHEMNRETQELEGLITTLSDKSLAEPLKTLGMSGIPEMLTSLNADFTAAIKARDAEALNRQPIKEADTHQLRNATDTLYHQVVDTVNAYALIQPAKEIDAFVQQMNVLVDKYKNVIANQGKRRSEASAALSKA